MTNENERNMLRFFGNITASVSHEIKNHIAIINEYAGLLEDSIAMSEKGTPVNLKKLSDIAGKIKNRVSSADRTIANLNMFGHSTDDLYYTKDINEILTLSVNLFQRMLLKKDIKLDSSLSENPVIANTSHFILMRLIKSCLDNFSNIVEKGETIILSCKKDEKSISIYLICETLSRPIEADISFFSKRAISEIANELNAEIFFDFDNKSLIIMIPAEIKKRKE